MADEALIPLSQALIQRVTSQLTVATKGEILPPLKREVLLPSQLMQAYTGAFKAAQSNRLTLDWSAAILSSDQELFANLRMLRGRSRQIAKNNHYGAKFLRQVEKNVIGKDGITFQAKVKKQRGEGLLDTVNQELLRAYGDWSKPDYCTVEGKMSRAAVERFFIRQVAMDGEVLVRKVPLPGNPYLFALQFIDPDQLDHTFFLNKLPNGNEIRMGVEVDQYHRPVAYHLWKYHPSEYTSNSQERIRVPASEILHCFLQLRVGQTRGIPWMAPSMLEMQLLDGYKTSEVTAARLSASKMGFFTSQTGTDETGDPAVVNPDGQASLTPGMGAQRMDAQPGTFENLPAGVDFKPWDPQHPQMNYAAFCEASLRGISSGLDVAYHELATDLKTVNYSSARVGLLDARDTWMMLQQWTMDVFCQPVYEAWLKAALLSEALKLDASGYEQYKDGAVWHGRGWDWVDPYKDTMASVLAVQNGLSTLTRELAKQGLDIDEILDERKRELDRISELGITVGTDTKGKADAASDPELAAGTGGEETAEEPGATQPKPNGNATGKPNGKPNGRAYLT